MDIEPVPILTLNVYSNSRDAVAKLDLSIQIVCDAKSTRCSLNIELIRNGTFITSHIVQFDGGKEYFDDGFLVITDSLTWADTPEKGINIYQIIAAVLHDDSSEKEPNYMVFAGTRSLNATVFE